MGSTTSWFILLIAGILLVVIGFNGALGKVVAVAFAPGLLQPQQSSNASNGKFNG